MAFDAELSAGAVGAEKAAFGRRGGRDRVGPIAWRRAGLPDPELLISTRAVVPCGVVAVLSATRA